MGICWVSFIQGGKIQAIADILLGTGPQLQQAIGHIIDSALDNLNRQIAARTASAAVASAVSPTTQEQNAAQQLYESTNGSDNYYGNGTSGHNMAASQGTYMNAQQGHQEQARAPSYPGTASYTYPGVQNGAMAYAQGTMGGYDSAAYSSEEAKPNIEAQLQAAAHEAQASNFMAAFQSPTAPVNGNGFQQSPQQAEYPQAGPAAWRHFANSMMTNVSGQEYLQTPAGALMALSGGKSGDGSMDIATATMGNIAIPNDGSTQPWPLLQYTGGPGDGHQ